MNSQGLNAMAATAVADTGGPKVATAGVGTVSQDAQAVAAAKKTAASVEADPAPKAAERAEVSAAAKQIESYLRAAGREFEFRVDEDTHITVVTVRQASTGEIIRQIPNEEVLQLARNLGSGPNALLDLTI
jgi:flagellar protein FlaG